MVHCAASGFTYPPLVPVWGRTEITLQPIRAGFPCFGAALTGYVEATREDDVEKNRLCPPSPYGNTLGEWVVMNVRGVRATMSFGSEPDIKAWADQTALNPARIDPAHADSAAIHEVLERQRTHLAPGLARLAALAGVTSEA
jgi:hypothetical protein